jgi:predicted AlkP superfamily phosphohydrolase/phosphomutase
VPPIVFVGLDAADRTLARSLAGQGRLPALRSLLDQGRTVDVESPYGLFVGAVWPTFATGVNAGRHGRYCFGQLRPGTYAVHRTGPDLPTEPFWRPLSRAGRRVAIIDIPHTRPDPDINGIQLVDWARHDPNVGFCTAPVELAGEVVEGFGSQPSDTCDVYARRGALGELRDDLVDGIGRKADLCESYLGDGGWDVFAVAFSGSHCGGHQGWALHDPSHPRHDSVMADRVGDPIVDVYEAQDAALGRILAVAGSDATVMVLLSHGMGPHYDATFMLSEMLRRIAAKRSRPSRFAETRELARRAIGRVARTPGGRTPGAFMWYVDGGRPYFTVPNNDVYGGVRINLKRREPGGLVAPGREYDDVCQMLEHELMTWTNLETGQPLVQRVAPVDDYYAGPERATLPDLVVEWNRTAPIRSIGSPDYGRIAREYAGNRTGDHIPGGLLVTRGPGIAPAPTNGAIPMVDLAPTICSAVDVELAGVDGTPHPELIEA